MSVLHSCKTEQCLVVDGDLVCAVSRSTRATRPPPAALSSSPAAAAAAAYSDSAPTDGRLMKSRRPHGESAR